MKFKGIVFDYNGVLSDDLKIMIQIYADIANENGGRVSFKEMWKALALAPPEKFRRFLPPEKWPLLEKFVREKSRRYSAVASSQNVLFPLTEKVIPKLQKKYRLAIITHTNDTDLRTSLPKKLADFFETIWTLKDLKEHKPHPHSLKELVKKWGVKPAEVAYVGDSYNDMRFAKNAGCYAVGITAGESNAKELEKAGADRIIKNLDELLELEKP